MNYNRMAFGRATMGLALIVSAASTGQAAAAADPAMALFTTLLRAAVQQGEPAVDALSATERSQLEQLKPSRAEMDRMIDRATRSQASDAMTRAATGYQTVQNTVGAAVNYWSGTRQPQQAASYGDPYGFTAWLNGVRAQYGLPPVAYDPNLSAWANANNAQQQAMGMGHYVMGPARRQNSAIGSAATVGAQWLASPAHAAAMLDPTIRAIGIAGMGAYWTFNAR